MTTVDASKAVFRIENLTINFPAKRQSVPSPLQGLNLTIQENKITTILGQSGCGKSTLLNALGGFVMGEDSGGVLYRQRYLNAPLEEIVMIFQENNLYPWLSVAGNVNFGLRFRNQYKKDVKATVRRMLDSVGLSEAQARGRFDTVTTYHSRFRPMLQALGEGQTRSLFKMVCAGADEKVVGIHLLGEGADEILQGFAVALKAGVTRRQMADTVAIHPTSAEEVVLMR